MLTVTKCRVDYWGKQERAEGELTGRKGAEVLFQSEMGCEIVICRKIQKGITWPVERLSPLGSIRFWEGRDFCERGVPFVKLEGPFLSDLKVLHPKEAERER